MIAMQGRAVPSSVESGRPAVHPKVLLLAALAERFLPHVEAVLRPRAKSGIVALMGLITQRAPEIRGLLVSLRDGTARAARVRAFAACGIGLKPLTVDALARKVEASIVDAVESATFTLALGWLDAFLTRGETAVMIDTDRIDDAMLPPLDAEHAARFRDSCRRAGLDVDEARRILAAVRAELPKGDVIPDEALLLMDAALITAIC